jgi:hypothetical protein
MGGFNVTPSELHQAGGTLRSVRSELSAGSDLSAGGDVGYPDLAEAMADFCRTASDAAADLATAISIAGENVDQGGSEYERTEAINARWGAGGPY